MKRGLIAAVLVAGALAAVVVLAYRAGSPVRITPGGPARERLPVLMIHGSGLGPSIWDGMDSHLRDQGWPADYLMAVELRPNNGANIAAAERQLKPAAHALLARAQARATKEGWPRPAKLAVIGHSMGAVSGRWLTARLIPGQVAAFIGIAAAHHGTDAICAVPGDGNDEICPAFPAAGQSQVLDALNGTRERPIDRTPYGPAADPANLSSVRPNAEVCISWYTLFIDPDEWIKPEESARLPGAGGAEPRELPPGIVRVAPGEFRLQGPVRHDDLPSAPAVTALVAALLSVAGECVAV